MFSMQTEAEPLRGTSQMRRISIALLIGLPMMALTACTAAPTDQQASVATTAPAVLVPSEADLVAAQQAAAVRSAASESAAQSAAASAAQAAADEAAIVAAEQAAAADAARVAAEQAAAAQVAQEQAALEAQAAADAAQAAQEDAAQQEQDLADDDAGGFSAEEQRILDEGFTGNDGTTYSPSTVQRGWEELGIRPGDMVPGYLRCGTECGESPTSGELQSEWENMTPEEQAAERARNIAEAEAAELYPGQDVRVGPDGTVFVYDENGELIAG